MTWASVISAWSSWGTGRWGLTSVEYSSRTVPSRVETLASGQAALGEHGDSEGVVGLGLLVG
ncbi:hypothetical protein [Nocardiopsis sp. JB363]|uniref:hypothetical protein n=1 Tax=Nocardiopsis sp. JB363 TaxID=1434837 RepID=UPI001F1BCB43|nr:hypothetical protein [Nocardiopsis sp. JB363]